MPPSRTGDCTAQNDQNSTRITPRRLERELKIMDSLWLEQKHYLEGVDASLAQSFPPSTAIRSISK